MRKDLLSGNQSKIFRGPGLHFPPGPLSMESEYQMVYKYPDATGQMVETPYLNDFIKGVEEARRSGYGPGHDTHYHPPKKAERMTLAQASERLKNELGIDLSSPAERAQAEFAVQLGREVARALQSATPAVSRVSMAPIASASRQNAPNSTRHGMSFAEASQKLKAELGIDIFADDGEGAPAAMVVRHQDRGAKPIAIRRFGPVMQLRQL